MNGNKILCNIDVIFFEDTLNVNFREVRKNEYRANEHSSYSLKRGKDGVLRLMAFNGDFGDAPRDAYQLLKFLSPNLDPADIMQRLGVSSKQHTYTRPPSVSTNNTETAAPKTVTFQESKQHASVFRTFEYFRKKIGVKSLDVLEAFHIRTVKTYGNIGEYRIKTPLFAYCEGSNIKIKDPQKAIFKTKIVLKTPIQQYVYGYEYLQSIDAETAKTIHILIVEGEDDVLAINYHCQNVKALTFGGVNNQFTAAIIEELRSKFASVRVAFDADEAGIKNAPVQAAKHNLPYMTCPIDMVTSDKDKDKNAKDFCDLLKVCKFNAAHFETIIKCKILEDWLKERETLRRNVLPQTYQNCPLYICPRLEAIEQAQLDDYAVVVCERLYIETAKALLDNPNIPIISYEDLSNIYNMHKNANIYCLGSQLLARTTFINAAKELRNLAKQYKVLLFADTDTNLPFASAKTNVLNYKPQHEIYLLDEKNPKAAFLKLAKEMPTAYYLECGKSITNHLDPAQKVSKSALGYAPQDMPLLVYVDRDLNILPNEFQRFHKVIFACSPKTIAANSVEKWLSNELDAVQANINRLENDAKFTPERDFLTYVGGTTIAPYFDKDTRKWVVDAIDVQAHTAAYQSKLYANNYMLLTQDLGATIHTFSADINSEVQQVQQEAQALKDEKKECFESFMEEIEDTTTIEEAIAKTATQTITTTTETGETISITAKRALNEGEKTALNRLKQMSKFVCYSLAFELVFNNYHRFTKAKMRAIVSMLLQREEGESRYADALRAFAGEFTEGWHTKEALIAAWLAHNLGRNHCDAELWKQVKRAFQLKAKQLRIKGAVTWVYRIELLE